MARDAGGTYSLPAGNPVVSGLAIDSSDHNDTVNDLASEMTDSLSRSGSGGMSAALGLFDGVVGTPGLNFVSDTDNGLYRIGADNYGLSVGGTLRLEFTTEGPILRGDHTVADFGTGGKVVDGEGNLRPIGLNVCIPEEMGANDTLALTDVGKYFYDDGTDRTMTLPADADIPVGAFFWFGSSGSAAVLLAPAATVTLRHADGSSTNPVTNPSTADLDPHKFAKLIKITDTLYHVFTTG